ncbi:MAG: maltose alpha-D-glucosyltransferase [Gemmatimonadota bacterium]
MAFRKIARERTGPIIAPDEALWYQDAVIYEARVGAFYDSDGDGIGDFRGMAEKLDYLHDLGITAIWLLPFYPSPLKDDGYDISDYTDVHPDCGTLDDFKLFLRGAHRRGIKVITELVINHTSDQHPWFQRARREPPGSKFRNYYVWSDTPEKYVDARIIFQDFEHSNWSWDPVAKAYYWHRFYAHQPDLNFENPEVRKGVFRFLDFWLKLGVDGFRLDAVPYLYEREGTNCENLPETHQFLRELRKHVDARHRNKMLLAEANQWPEDAVAFFGQGDECHMNFHFPLMPRLFMALQMEDRFPVIDILAQTPDPPPNCQWALFLRNHDELTLEMVTDEERDYMYRFYANDARARINLGIRRRLAPLLGNNRRKIELMNALLFSLPGTPVIYYGDEIGMGDNIFLGDRNGVRTPLQWSSDKNAGFSRANPQRLYLPIIIDPEYHYESVNIEAQRSNLSSLFWWMKRLIALRRRYIAFGRGSISFLQPANRKVLAFIRRYQGQDILMVANLAESVEFVELDLAAYRGRIPIELFSQNPLPRIGDLPYLLTMGPHQFYWFGLSEPEGPESGDTRSTHTEPPRLQLPVRWDGLLRDELRAAIEPVLPAFLSGRRWYEDKASIISRIVIQDSIEVPMPGGEASIAIVQVEYEDGLPRSYVIPVRGVMGDAAESIRRDQAGAIIAEVTTSGKDPESGVLYDPSGDPAFGEALLLTIARRRKLRGVEGEVLGTMTRAFMAAGGLDQGFPPVAGQPIEQKNTSLVFGQQFILKLYRRLSPGINPDVEIGRYLTEKAHFHHVPPVLGRLDYATREVQGTVAVLERFIPNEGDAWSYTTDQVRRYLEVVLARRQELSDPPLPPMTLLQLTEQDPPQLVLELFGGFLEIARLLGRRTGELHLALATGQDAAFTAEPFSTQYQRALYQSLRNLSARTFAELRSRMDLLPAEFRPDGQKLAQLEGRVDEFFKPIVGHKINTTRIRCHGDYHLGQMLHTGRDFVIIDFEGDPLKTVTERRLKRSPLTDVGSMIRSFDNAAQSVLWSAASGSAIRREDVPFLEPWARFWVRWVGSAFARAYLHVTAGASFIPTPREDLALLFRVLLLERAFFELGYELNNRPDWAFIPLRGILRILRATE